MRWCVVLAVVTGVIGIAQADKVKIGLVGSYNSEGITDFLEADDYYEVIQDPLSYTGLTAVIVVRTVGSPELKNYVASGGRLITEYTASIWALNTAHLLAASDTGGDLSGATRSVTFTEDGKMNVGKGMESPYADAGRTEFFRHLTLHKGSTAKVLANQDVNGKPAIIGGAYGKGNVVIIGYDWADNLKPGVGAPTQQLLLNAIHYEAVPLPAAVWGGLGLLGAVAGRKVWRRMGGRLNGQRAI